MFGHGPDPKHFVFGGTAGAITLFMFHPLDFLKSRMQVNAKENKSAFQAAKDIIKNEGLLTFYSGFSAGLLRQLTYTTTRVGIYTWWYETFTEVDGKPPGFGLKAAAGMGAGIIGSFIGTPAELALIRMTTDGSLPPADRRNYTNAFNALFRITKEEGWKNLWRGAVPTMARCMVTNAIQLATYTQAKEMLLSRRVVTDESITLHMLSAMVSGMVTTIITLPPDIIKTRIQSMKTIEGKPPAGMMEVLRNIIKNEGVWALWKGFAPYYARAGPHAVLTFIIFERIEKAYKIYVLGQTEKKIVK